MNYTTHYNLKKPAGTDNIAISDFNDNADALDTAVYAKYAKPASGIPATDLATAVQTTLSAVAGKYVKPATGIPASDLATDVQEKLSQIDTILECSTVNNQPDFIDDESCKINNESTTITEFGALVYADRYEEIILNNRSTSKKDTYTKIAHTPQSQGQVETITFACIHNDGTITFFDVQHTGANSYYFSEITKKTLITTSNFVNLVYDSTTNTIKVGTTTQTFAQIKALLTGNNIVRLTTTGETELILNPVNILDGVIIWNNVLNPDYYELQITNANVVTFIHSAL